MDLVTHLMDLEHRLATGAGAVYEETLTRDALVVVPGMVLDKTACVAAMDASPGWDRVELGEPRHITRAEAVTLVYTFSGWRGDEHYRATLSSTYVEEGTSWRLMLHTQTPTV
jgi:hypothetical protein